MAIKFLSDTTHKKGDIHLDGTSSERLDLDSGVKITGQYKANGNTEYTYINMYNGGDASINIGTKHNLGYISFESGNGAYTERMRITNTGKIGIGTTAPTKTLDVRGSSIISGSFSGSDANALVLDNSDSSGNPSILRMVFSGEGGNEALNIGMYSSPSVKPVYFQSTQGSGWGNIVFQTNGGNVGIGTNAPGTKLDVNGTVRVNNEVQFTNDQMRIYRSSNDMRLRTGSSDRMTITSTGRVGIGTSTPSSLLHLQSSSDYDVRFTRVGAEEFRLRHGTSGVYWTGPDTSTLLAGVDQNHDFVVFNNGGSHYATFDGSTSRVGIGTSSPAYKLDVRGKLNCGGSTSTGNYVRVEGSATENTYDVFYGKRKYPRIRLVDSVNGNNTNFEIWNLGNQLRFGSQAGSSTEAAFFIKHGNAADTIFNGTVGIGNDSPVSNYKLHVDGIGRPALFDSTNAASTVKIANNSTGNGTYNGLDFVVNSTSNNNINSYGMPLTFGTSSTNGNNVTERMRIASDGKVGIGTTSPAEKLDVNGNIKATKLLLNTTSTGYTLYSNGESRINNVIFQKSSNTDYLQKSSAAGAFYVRNAVSGQSLYVGANDSGGAFDNYMLVSGANNNITFRANGSDRLFIKSDGNVGIGTTSPSSKLHVAGAIKTSGDVTMSSNTTLHIGNVDLTTGSGGNTVSVEAATSSGTAMNFKTSSGTVAAYMVYQGTTTTRFNGIVEPAADRTHDLGKDAQRWRVVYCETLDSAGQHESNLQDREQPVGQYITGTVLSWKNGKNRPCTQFADHMRMGIAVLGQDSPLIQGAEPVLCTGIVEEGDYLVTSEKEGHAVAIPRHIVKEQLLFDCVIGKALQGGEGESHLIKTWINI